MHVMAFHSTTKPAIHKEAFAIKRHRVRPCSHKYTGNEMPSMIVPISKSIAAAHRNAQQSPSMSCTTNRGQTHNLSRHPVSPSHPKNSALMPNHVRDIFRKGSRRGEGWRHCVEDVGGARPWLNHKIAQQFGLSYINQLSTNSRLFAGK